MCDCKPGVHESFERLSDFGSATKQTYRASYRASYATLLSLVKTEGCAESINTLVRKLVYGEAVTSMRMNLPEAEYQDATGLYKIRPKHKGWRLWKTLGTDVRLTGSTIAYGAASPYFMLGVAENPLLPLLFLENPGFLPYTGGLYAALNECKLKGGEPSIEIAPLARRIYGTGDIANNDLEPCRFRVMHLLASAPYTPKSVLLRVWRELGRIVRGDDVPEPSKYYTFSKILEALLGNEKVPVEIKRLIQMQSLFSA